MFVAIEGCGHGELDRIYETIREIEADRGIKVDLLLCCGDFQSVRNFSDLKCMACPVKYMQLQTFYKYYSGECIAPVLTIFVGGNHEASNYLTELPFGGWVAPNIYYLGYAGVVNFGGLRIAGISGIFKGHDYCKGHYEFPRLTYQGNLRSVYHVRQLEIFRMKQLKKTAKIDMMISHDWPRGIPPNPSRPNDASAPFTVECNTAWLLNKKRHFTDDVYNDRLGCRPYSELLSDLKPNAWFSAHLHVRFPALIRHRQTDKDIQPEETRFLALDKVLPRGGFLEVIEIPARSEHRQLSHDRDWLTVLRTTDHLMQLTRSEQFMPGPGCSERYDFNPTEAELAETDALMNNDYVIDPSSFRMTVPPATPTSDVQGAVERAAWPGFHANDQTERLCNRLQIRSWIQRVTELSQTLSNIQIVDEIVQAPSGSAAENPDAISLEDSDSDTEAKPERPKIADLACAPPPTDEDAAEEEEMMKLLAKRRADAGAAEESGLKETSSIGTFDDFYIDTKPDTVPASDSVPPEQKRVKRRNADMYEAQEDDTV